MSVGGPSLGAMTTETLSSAESLAPLRAAVDGPVLFRDDAALAEEVLGFNTAVSSLPDVVVGATSEADVVQAVRFAVTAGLPVHVQSTGHGVFAPVSGGMLIVTKRMDAVTIDPDTRLATVGAGVKWGAVIAAGVEHGLAPIVGSSPTVGAIGLTLGGGLGPLARSHGATVDWVRGFRVVTADGEVVTASAEENAELFWALRGGKGGFGVVTEMTLELAPLRTIYAGGLFFDGEENIETALRAWAEWTQTAPDTVTTSVAIMRMPDFEMVPPPLRGRTLLNLRFAYPGDAAEGERLISPLRASAPVYIDAVAEIPYSAVGTIHNDPEEGSPAWVYGTALTGIDQDVLSAMLEHVGPSADSPFLMAELRHMGGAVRPADVAATATGGRDAAYLLTLIALNPTTFGEIAPRVAGALIAAIAASLSPVTNVNFSGNPADPIIFERSWPEQTRTRLAAARTQYDPNRVFPFGPPATVA